MRLRIDSCTLDLDRRELRDADGQLVAIEPRVLDVVAFLARNDGRVVTKNELLDEIWGDRFVSEWALSTAIKEARRALGDDGRRQRVIQTVHGRGFRLAEAMVTTYAPSGPSPARRTCPIGASWSVALRRSTASPT